MPIIKQLQFKEDTAPSTPTAAITINRIVSKLTERFENHIHKRECATTQSDYKVKMGSRSIAAFVTQCLGNLPDEEAGASVCDSSSDGGIDSIAVNHTEKTVVVVQSKYDQQSNGTLTKSDLLSFKDACNNLLEQKWNLFDEILRARQKDIETAIYSSNYKFFFVFAHTGKNGAAPLIIEMLNKWQDELSRDALVEDPNDFDALPFQVHLVCGEDIANWMHTRKTKKIDLDNVVIQDWGRVLEPYQAFYGKVDAYQLANWWNDYEDFLISKNIRGPLLDTDVNEAIKNTALNTPELFWYFNNGITVLANSVEVHLSTAPAKRDTGVFSFKGVSVINGAQTISTIGRLFKSSTEDIKQKLTSIYVSVRFIKISDSSEFSEQVTRANNFQNRVLGRDFASQHQEQIRLRKEVSVEGYDYEILRSGDNSPPNDKSFDLDVALNALACLSNSGSILATLKSNRGKFFENLDGRPYTAIFNPSVTGVKLINSVLHYKAIDKMIQAEISNENLSDNRRRLILNNGRFVISSILLKKIGGLANSNNIIEPTLDAYQQALPLYLEQISDYLDVNFPTAYPARFFENVQKVTDLIEKIS